MRELKIGAILICFIIGMTLVISDVRPSIRTSRNIKEEVIHQISLRTYQQTRNVVSSSRAILYEELKDDGKLLYNSTQSAKWRTQYRLFDNISNEIDRCLEVLDDRSPLYTDLNTTKNLLDAAWDKRDLQALVDAYNILHDLENFFFYHYRTEVYHGVTKTLTGEVKYKTQYLEK